MCGPRQGTVFSDSCEVFLVAATLSALHQEYGEPMVSPTRTTEAAADVARPLTSRDQEEPGDKGSQSQEIIGTTRCVSGNVA